MQSFINAALSLYIHPDIQSQIRTYRQGLLSQPKKSKSKFLQTVSIFQLLHEAETCFASMVSFGIWPIHILVHVQLYFLRKLHPSVNLRHKNMNKATWALILFQRVVRKAASLHTLCVPTWPCLQWAGRGRWSSPSRAPLSGPRWTRSWSFNININNRLNYT